MSERAAPSERDCPTCGEPAEWMEELAEQLEFGCVNHHSWTVEK